MISLLVIDYCRVERQGLALPTLRAEATFSRYELACEKQLLFARQPKQRECSLCLHSRHSPTEQDFRIAQRLRSSKALSLFLLCLEKQTDCIKDVAKVCFNSPRPLLIIHISINNVKKFKKKLTTALMLGECGAYSVAVHVNKYFSPK